MWILRLLAALVAGALPRAVTAADLPDLDALYARAAQQGEVSLYAQGPPQVYGDFVRQFEAKYPRVHVRVTPGRYDIIAKIDEQLAAGRLDADLATVQTAQDYVRWKKGGALAGFAPEGFAGIPAGLKDPEAQYLPLSANVIGFAYNAAAVGGADAPRTMRDFLKPLFKDKIVSTYPHDDDVTLFNYWHVVQKYGWGMIESLMSQRPKFVRSHVLVSQALASGERPVTFDQVSTFNKNEFVAPDDVPLTVFPYVTGVFAKAPHPDAARLFVAFCLSKEQQARMVTQGIWSPRPDLGPPAGFKPLASYATATDYIAFISDEAQAKDLRRKFAALIGPIEGQYINTSPAPAAPGK
jgi:ABC-type Fe3+ transport system substrate-binding protein